MGSPSISVIVPAHHRREYVLTAVDSVLGQRQRPEEVEVLVVKNFPDETIDRALDERSVPRILTEAGPLGAKLRLGIDAARGPVIAFLEDDDLFRPGRLDRLLEVFRDPTVGYFHNAIETVDGAGRALPVAFHEGATTDRELAATDRRRGDVRAFLRLGPGFNLSSTAVRREALAAALPYLARTNLTCDNLVSYSALLAPFKLVNDGRRWTGYRLHASASWTPTDPDGFYARETEKWRAIVAGFELIVEMTRESPVAGFARRDLLLRRGMLSLAADPGTEPFGPRDFLELLATWPETTEGISTRRTIAALALRSVAPPLERRLYAEYVRSQSRGLGVA